MAKFMFWPVRIFQHEEGRYLCKADGGCKLGCKGLFLVRWRQEDTLFYHLTKFRSPTTKFIFQIYICTPEGIARYFRYIPLEYMKIVNFELVNHQFHMLILTQVT